MTKKIISIASLLLVILFVEAEVKLPAVFSDNMVLQQKSKVKIWGSSSNQEEVTVSPSWSKKKYVVPVQDDGHWSAYVSTPSFGGPYDIQIDDGQQLVLKNILIGEVWVCSGQSNMEMPLAGWGNINNFKEEIAAANFPDIRFLQVQHTTRNRPVQDAEVQYGGWVAVTPQTIAEFSATAYFFARELYEKTGIPIGLIHTSWGGTVAEAWTSTETLNKIPDFQSAIQRLTSADAQAEYEHELHVWNQIMAQHDEGQQDGEFGWLSHKTADSDWSVMQLPTLWDTDILPNFDGVVYFRKEIQLPKHWIGEKLYLQLGMIDDEDVTYWNGKQVGTTQGYNQNRVYEIPASLVQSTDVTIAVRVFDSGGGGGIYGEAAQFNVVGPNGEYLSLASDWKYKIGVDLAKLPEMPTSNEGPNRPTVLYNAMIHPFTPFKIRGAIWYQGESNADRAHQYRKLFPDLIRDWRTHWNQGDFPFYYVQLANFMHKEPQPIASAWAELRDAQKGALQLPNTGMAVIADIGDADDIHPKNKQEVGRRLALIALKKTYKKAIVFSGPILRSFVEKNGAIHLTFDPVGKRLINRNEEPRLTGFTIAGEDQVFYNAEALLHGDKVIVKASQVSKPVSVRYGWTNNPDLSLYNDAGLPASPFKTDNWKDSTQKARSANPDSYAK